MNPDKTENTDKTVRRPVPPRGSLATKFSGEIEAAVSAGVEREAMTLRLTLRDASNIRRDGEIPVQDLSFTGGEMRLLKVKVVAGGVDVSKLDLGQTAA